MYEFLMMMAMMTDDLSCQKLSSRCLCICLSPHLSSLQVSLSNLCLASSDIFPPVWASDISPGHTVRCQMANSSIGGSSSDVLYLKVK